MKVSHWPFCTNQEIFTDLEFIVLNPGKLLLSLFTCLSHISLNMKLNKERTIFNTSIFEKFTDIF